MENEPKVADCEDTAANLNLVPNTAMTAVRLVLKEEKCDKEETLNIDNPKAVESLDICTLDTSLNSEVPESQNEFINEELIEENLNPEEEESYSSIMNVCSSAAQHIRQTITEVLNSRQVEETEVSACSSEASVSLEASLKEKLANFEQTCMFDSTPKAQNQDTSPDDVSMQILPTLSESETPNPQITSEDLASLTSKIQETESSESQETITVERHPSCGESSDSQNSDICINNKNSISQINIEKSHKKSQKITSNKKKGEKTVDQILKSLSNYSTSEEKLQALCRKHSETLEDLKSTELRNKQSERQVIQLAREKEQLQAEHNRMVLAKSRLESLCRELQRQNKAVKEESLLRIREEEEKRKDVASKFQTTLNEISTLMQENSKKNLQLKEENSELAKKLKTLVEHYEMWEKHMEKVVQQKDLESQLAKAKQAKTNLQLKQETEKFLREKQSLLENMSDLQKRCTQLASNELQLRAELGDYTNKYEEFQTVLNKSNQVFATFKTDMETTSKKIKKLEKETNIWKQKWETSNKALLEMITDKQKRDKELVNAQQRILTLEKLCRALQAERNDLQNQVNQVKASSNPAEAQ